MTSNQIANASNQIQQQSVDEAARHNQAVEEETKRHNLATEDLQNQSLRIEDDKRYWDAWYKQESAAIQKEYNRWYAQWTEASGTRKLEIEAMLAHLKESQTTSENRYRTEMAAISQREADLKTRAQEEAERVNAWTKQFRETEIKQNDYRLWLQNKQQEYQNSYWNASIQLGNLNATYDWIRNQQNYELGVLGIEVEKAKLQRDLASMEINKKLVNAQTFKYYLEGVGNLFGAATKAVSPFAFGKF